MIALQLNWGVRQHQTFMTRMNQYYLVGAIALIVPSVLAAQRSPQVQVFSSLAYIEEAGDVVGTELLLIRTPRGVCVSYQIAEGAPGAVRIVSAIARGDSLQFTIPPDSGYSSHRPKDLVDIGPARSFRGRVLQAGIRAMIEGDGERIWLPRRRAAYYPESTRRLRRLALKEAGATRTSWCM